METSISQPPKTMNSSPSSSSSSSSNSAKGFFLLDRGTWSAATATGYKDVGSAFQWRVVPSFTGELLVTLCQGYKSPCAALSLAPADARGARASGQMHEYSKFSNVRVELRAPVKRGVAYTLVLCTYAALKEEETEHAWSISGGDAAAAKGGAEVSDLLAPPPVLPPSLLEPLSPLTQTLAAILAAEAAIRATTSYSSATGFPFCESGTWSAATATGYKDVGSAFQWRVVPSFTGELLVTLCQGYKSPCAALSLAPADARGARASGQMHEYSKFSNVRVELRAPVKRGVAYTLVLCTYAALKEEETERAWSISGGDAAAVKVEAEVSDPLVPPMPLPPSLLEPLSPVTLSLATVLTAETAVVVSKERLRRKNALAAAAAAAAAAGPRSTARMQWEDFLAAQAKVEAVRASVRAAGGGRYRDGWSGTAAALGDKWEEGKGCMWADLPSLAPHSTLVDGGYSLADVMQGQLGDCYFLAALSNLARSGGTPGAGGGGGGVAGNTNTATAAAAGEEVKLIDSVLDSLLVTGEENPEGVYCVRLWVLDHFVHIIMDGLIPARPSVYRTAADPRALLSLPSGASISPAEGRYAYPLSIHSSSMNEMWPCFVEKAWAKLHGSYAAIQGRACADQFPLNFFVPHSLPGFLEVLPLELNTPAPPALGSGAGALSEGGEAATLPLIDKMRSWLGKGWPLTAASRDAVKGGDHGIVRFHAFTVLRVFPAAAADATTSGATSTATKPAPLLVQLRNPWGRGEWDGSFSDSDTASWTPALRAATGYDSTSSGDDGVFWMSLSDFCGQFGHIYVTPAVRLAKDGGVWHKKTLRCAAAAAKVPSGAGVWGHLKLPQLLLFTPGVSQQQHLFHVHVEFEGRREAAAGTLPSTILHAFTHVGGKGDKPVVVNDLSYPVSNPALKQEKGISFVGNGAHSTSMVNAPADSSLVLVIELPKDSHAAVDGMHFVVTVLFERPFSLRVGRATAGTATATDDGVVHVSDP